MYMSSIHPFVDDIDDPVYLSSFLIIFFLILRPLHHIRFSLSIRFVQSLCLLLCSLLKASSPFSDCYSNIERRGHPIVHTWFILYSPRYLLRFCGFRICMCFIATLWAVWCIYMAFHISNVYYYPSEPRGWTSSVSTITVYAKFAESAQ